LGGLTFTAKDSFDVAGHRTGNGHPDWLATHEPADSTAWPVQCLLEAGADLVGKTQCDELQFSLNGENAHYGTPLNPAAPGRVPGGSSSGTASAVAGGLADFGLGVDCGGSVRIPASYGGILGMRPSHGRISGQGCVPLAPSFDTIGWFARDAGVFERIGRALLGDTSDALPVRRIIVAEDAFGLTGHDVRHALDDAVQAARALGGQVATRLLAQMGSTPCCKLFGFSRAPRFGRSTARGSRNTNHASGRACASALSLLRASRRRTRMRPSAFARRQDAASAT
jgi:amidase